MFSLNKRGVGMTSFFIGILITVIIAVAVAIPIVEETVTNLTTAPVNGTATITGTPATLLGYISLLLVVVIIIAIVNAI